ncbi:MAG: hypothetical protein LRY71_19100 [Bacillaceae bacterium]|nr:hypothetical protein [Bacillaceae bacterium]
MVVSRYQINHPDLVVNVWSKIDISNLDTLIKEISCDRGMTQRSINVLKDNKRAMVLNLGTFRIELENIAEIDPTINILEKELETANNKI